MPIKETPILMSRPMARQTRDNNKTNTRRLKGLEEINECPERWTLESIEDGRAIFEYRDQTTSISSFIPCPYGAVGDCLWVRETWSTSAKWNYLKPSDLPIGIEDIYFAADYDEDRLEGLKPWRPSIFLPRRYSRFLLKITDIRAERLQDISEDDAVAEGVEKNVLPGCEWREADGWRDYTVPLFSEGFPCVSPADSFITLWQSINGFESAEMNPWVWVLKYEKDVSP
jgi:hypothetical protein